MRFALLLPLLFAASCAEELPSDLMADVPVEVAGPPGALTLTITPLVPGASATFRVTGARPNQMVGIYRSSAVQAGGACTVAGIAPQCLDLRSPATRTFNVRANGAGVASITVTLPNPLALTSAAWQAAYRAGAVFDTSAAASYTVHQPSSDNDYDGVTAIEEVSTFQTNPGLADTDGGGAGDGQEIGAGTNPLVPGDDPAPPTYTASIAPIVSAHCGGCHLNGGASGGRSWGTYQDFFQVANQAPALAEIEPGSPAESYMYRKLQGTHIAAGGSGVRMPRGGPYLNATELQTFADWINAGAPQ
jgi:hypothetical protein